MLYSRTEGNVKVKSLPEATPAVASTVNTGVEVLVDLYKPTFLAATPVIGSLNVIFNVVFVAMLMELLAGVNAVTVGVALVVKRQVVDALIPT